MERPPLRYLKPTPGKTVRTLNEAEIEATVKNNLTLAAALLANQPVDPEVWKPAAVALANGLLNSLGAGTAAGRA